MSIQSPFGDDSRSADDDAEWRGRATRPVGDALVASLAGGLRSVYRAEPEDHVPTCSPR